MSVTEWIDRYVPGGVDLTSARCASRLCWTSSAARADETSALNLVYLLGQDDSTASGAQPHGEPQSAGADEKWHLHGGNDQLITGILARLPHGVLHLRPAAGGRPAAGRRRVPVQLRVRRRHPGRNGRSRRAGHSVHPAPVG